MRPGWVLRLLALYGFWLLLEQRFLLFELVVGVGVVAIALLVDAAAGNGPRGRGRLAPRLLRPALLLPGRLVADSARLARLIVLSALRGRRAGGRYRRLPFAGDAGAQRRALASWYGSFTPASYVVGFDRAGEAMLVHELASGAEPPVGAELGGRP